MNDANHVRSLSGRLRLPLLLGALAALLTACPGPTGGGVFVPENIWQGKVPAGAELVSPNEFEAQVAADESFIVSPATVRTQAGAREERRTQDVAYLSGLTTPPPVIDELLDRVHAGGDSAEDATLALPGGKVVELQGLDTALHGAATAFQLANDVGNALAVYRQAYGLLPDGLRARATDPAELTNASLTRLRQALQAMNDLLHGADMLDAARLELTPVAPAARAQLPAPADVFPDPGHGTDEMSGCSAPKGLVSKFWFPLKNFVSDVKDQGGRGTCWAFVSAGMVESRELVQHGSYVDLSEQFIANRAKFDWFRSDYNEGSSASKVLNEAVARSQGLPLEADWTYNPAPSKPSTDTGKAADFDGVCDAYDGTCSESAHESPMLCTYRGTTAYCAFQHVTFATEAQVEASNVNQVWANGQPFPLDFLRLFLTAGYPLIASMPVYVGFEEDDVGVVNDYRRQYRDKAGMLQPGPRGNHVVMIVGFIGNDELAAEGEDKVGGGGMFIIKNSWGCVAGDGGYYYVPASYVSQNFNDLSYLAFGFERSEAWLNEQAHGQEPPEIDILQNPATVDLGVKTDLSDFFKVELPAAEVLEREVDLKIASDVDGVIFHQPWLVDYSQNFGFQEAPFTFRSVGTRTLRLTATYQATTAAPAAIEVNVVNTPPTLTLHGSGEPREGDPFSITASVHDVNGDDLSDLCAATHWSVSAPDTLSTDTGCLVTVDFGIAGDRTVSATTEDTQGLSTTMNLDLQVQVPLDNPYPRITAAGVESLDFELVGQFYICGGTAVSNGATIDLREDGCTILVGGDVPPRYRAIVQIDNPDDEALTYDWYLYVTYLDGDHDYWSALASGETTFPLRDVQNSGLNTLPCRVEVRVNAPDPARAKSRIVWSGSCTLETFNLN